MSGQDTAPLYEWEDVVRRGKGLGRSLGFATANLPMPAPDTVRQGVYAGRVRVEGAWWPAVVNIGKHPTAPDGPPATEAHVIGYAGELYGKRVRVRLTHFLREEKRFESLEALRAQIGADVAEAARLMGE